ncbi:DNA polymerase III subunit gamma/tau [Cellvibrio fibrivorans]|uniref:DNA polymerase III subunit gamma/tau n=1 Tax=Cellvibrio fibrivorans TaxID=126350 RepID=A0ABU1UY15_9GAMM|nr:DNA polymerase III subunit gamma/tau [Cellvibrio fibrivorans]MDR7090007.1 DNA polymerase-3 subunit gamma/tau [Cellvibrio fibrivorans]
MSYQVLARKWRPRVFREMVGQEHVLQALINALDHNRLHHAYLFTGTRGVGKTTIARILAKCLNCETGVSSEPCGQCSSCREIAEGRFVDLIEVDAASRTKVEDTRELLENVQYAPTRGRYKVYLIDEVHMLSNSSFNALLKTLEEPPPHVKFLLATTDPQKLPMTILSRCLQFNLKNMNPERIVQHLKFVLNEELVPFEESALWHLGRAADGSMRDAMSLTDQAIAYGSGKITEAEVSTMLGTIDQTAVYDIVNALASLDGRAVLAAVERMSEQAPDYASALAEMLAVLHRIAIAQALPEAVDNSHGDRERIMQLAQQLPSEDVQLFYQTALLGRRDLPLAPDPRAGFEMVLLRMLAFKPQGVMEVPTQALPQSTTPIKPAALAPVAVANVVAANAAPAAVPVAAPLSVTAPVPAVMTSLSVVDTSASVIQPAPTSPEPPVFEGSYGNGPDDDYVPAAEDEYEPAPAYYEAPATAVPEVNEPKKPEAAQPPVAAAAVSVAVPAAIAPAEPIKVPASKTLRKVPYEQASPADWTEIYLGLGVTGILQSTVANCQMINRQGNDFYFVLDKANSTLYDTSHEKRLADLLSDYFVEPVRAHIQLGEITAETPSMMAIRLREERLQDAISAIKNDPIVQQLIAQFGATLREETIQPV